MEEAKTIIMEADDELLTKKDLCERILKCDIKTAEKHILYQAKFPYLMVGKQKRYPKKAVEKWIKDNTHYI